MEKVPLKLKKKTYIFLKHLARQTKGLSEGDVIKGVISAAKDLGVSPDYSDCDERISKRVKDTILLRK